jgi:hypothetical protein
MKNAAALSILVAVILLAVAVIAEAQQPKKVPRENYRRFAYFRGQNFKRSQAVRSARGAADEI